MRIKNEFAPLLLLPICVLLFFWGKESLKKKNDFSFKEIKTIILDGDEDFIEKKDIEKEIKKIKEENIKNINEINKRICNITGVEECFLSYDLNKILTIKIKPTTIFAKYISIDGDNAYIDTNFKFIKKNILLKKNIFIIENEMENWNFKKKEILTKILKTYEKPYHDFFYKVKIDKNGDSFFYKITNNEKIKI